MTRAPAAREREHMQTFAERAAYVRKLLACVDATPTDRVVRELVRTWVFDGFSRMVGEVRAMRDGSGG